MKKRESGAAVNERQPAVLFDAEQIGRSLREVAVDVIETEGSTILSRWFHSKHDVELFLWVDGDKNVIKHQVTFYGQVVEWNVFEGVKTGVVIEEEGPTGDDESVRETLQFDAQPESAAINRALLVLNNVSVLPDADRRRICDNLKFRVRGEPNSDDEFIRRYGEVYGREQNRRTTFWKRLKRWFGSGT